MTNPVARGFLLAASCVAILLAVDPNASAAVGRRDLTVGETAVVLTDTTSADRVVVRPTGKSWAFVVLPNAAGAARLLRRHASPIQHSLQPISTSSAIAPICNVVVYPFIDSLDPNGLYSVVRELQDRCRSAGSLSVDDVARIEGRYAQSGYVNCCESRKPESLVSATVVAAGRASQPWDGAAHAVTFATPSSLEDYLDWLAGDPAAGSSAREARIACNAVVLPGGGTITSPFPASDIVLDRVAAQINRRCSGQGVRRSAEWLLDFRHFCDRLAGLASHQRCLPVLDQSVVREARPFGEAVALGL